MTTPLEHSPQDQTAAVSGGVKPDYTPPTDVYVDHLSYALGDEERDVHASVANGLTLTGVEAFTDAGFGKHWTASPKTTAYDLSTWAVDPIQEHLRDVDAIIYATCLTLNGNLGTEDDFKRTRDVKYHLDYPGSHLQSYLELPNASVIGLNQQACTSVLGSIRLARALLHTERKLQKILCVSADRFPEGAHYEQAYNLISDGASAFTVSKKPSGFRVLGTSALTNGAMAQADDDETVGQYFGYTNQVIGECLEDAGLTTQDIDWVVPQNTNQKAWIILSRIFGLDMERVYFGSIKEVGHIISSDNIVNLAMLEKSGKLKSGHRLLLTMAGYGLNWQAVILEKV